MKKSRFTRLAAIVLAAATLWVTAVTAGADSLRSAIAAVRDSARLPVALLRWELGDTFPVDALALPAMLALRESPLLLSAWAEVSSLPASDDATPRTGARHVPEGAGGDAAAFSARCAPGRCRQRRRVPDYRPHLPLRLCAGR